jgi:hypothetical protein
LNLKGCAGIGPQLVTPLVISGLADLLRGADFCHGSALKSLDDKHRFDLGVPLTLSHG